MLAPHLAKILFRANFQRTRRAHGKDKMRLVLQRLSKLNFMIILLTLLLAMSGCSGCGSTPVQQAQPTPPPPAPTSNEPQSFTLVDLNSGTDYQLSGTGDSQTMTLRVLNRTNRTWHVEVEEGTKLEPAEGSVQNMVVTHGIHVTVHPHDEPETSVEVACLDISKAAPAASNTSWSARQSPNLTRFLACVNGIVDDLKTEDSQHASSYEQARRSLLQSSLWQARGASKQDWIDFYVKYQGMTEDEARAKVEAMEPVLNEVTNNCPNL